MYCILKMTEENKAMCACCKEYFPATRDYFYWKNNKPWFSDLYNRVKNDDLISYMLNSWDYRNRVSAAYILHYEIYLNQLVNYKKDALKIIEDINMRIE